MPATGDEETDIVGPDVNEYFGNYSDSFARNGFSNDGCIQLGGSGERWLQQAAWFTQHHGHVLDASIHKYIVTHSAYSSPLGYSGFPKSCCMNVNKVKVHGIPDDRPLEDGDIVNIDTTVYSDGYHGDTSRPFLIGDVEPGHKLVAAASEALEAGIAICGPGNPFKSIGKAIHDVADWRGYSVSVSVSVSVSS